MKHRLTRKFIKHVAVTDLFVFIALFCYDILSWLIPVVRIRLGGIILILLIIDLCLVSIKLINNYDFGTHR
ncbi:hypothetical protein [Limosilactobacillus oris]|uniref:hypothetical protein n=1 Tax=Limosilactobacillus oris TaxID=1632 RepID=UPI0024B88D6F|nr:hypothetical protein [Limosilactobacillus oris]